jgi:hypothetical protein
MKKKEQANPDPSLTYVHKQESSETGRMFKIPPGVEFSDIYMDAQEVSMALKVGKRVVTNARRAGKLSYTCLYKGGKIFYLKQEIAAMMEANIVKRKNITLNVNGLKSLIAAAISMASVLPDWEFMLS